MRGSETIQVFRKFKVGRLDASPNPTETPHHEESGCIVYPRTSTELGKGEVIIDGENVFAPGRGRDVLATDRIKIVGRGDQMYTVEGKPGDYRMHGRQKGLLIVLKSVGGA